MQLDISNEETGFEPLEGTYDAVVQEVKHGTSNSGNQKLIWTFRIPSENTTREKHTPLHTALFNLKSVLEGVFPDRNFDDPEEDGNIDTAEIVESAQGKDVLLRLAKDTYTNSDGEEVETDTIKGVYAAGGTTTSSTENVVDTTEANETVEAGTGGDSGESDIPF